MTSENPGVDIPQGWFLRDAQRASARMAPSAVLIRHAASARIIGNAMLGAAAILEGATHCLLPTGKRGALADARAQAIVQRDRIDALIKELGGES